MPAKSQKQFKFIQAMRSKYGSKEKAPEDMKWVFDEKWTDNVDYESLPENRIEKYISLFEKRMQQFKAWYNPESDYWYQFSTNLIHNEVAKDVLKMDAITAKKNGYIEVYVVKDLNIRSEKIPTDREFNALKYKIENHSYPFKIENCFWHINGKDKTYHFPKQSFFLVDSIKSGKKTNFSSWKN